MTASRRAGVFLIFGSGALEHADHASGVGSRARDGGYRLVALICVGGLGVVAATAVVEAVGDGRPTSGGIALVLTLVAAMLLVAGIVTLVAEARRGRRTNTAPTRACTADGDLERGAAWRIDHRNEE